MIGSVAATRRAHAFAQLLDASPLGEEAATTAEVDQALTDLANVADAPTRAALAVVRELTTLPRPSLNAATRTAQRAQLVAAVTSAAAPSSPAPAPSPSQEPQALQEPAQTPAEASPEATTAPTVPEPLPEQRRRRLRAVGGGHRSRPTAPHEPAAGPAPGGGGRPGEPSESTGLVARLRPRTRLSKGLAASGLTMGVAAGALGGAAAASTDALPGDTLYGLKRGMEDLRLDFARGDVDRGRLYLDHAATRLNEARRLMERGRTGQLDEEELAEVRRALSSMRDDASTGHRLLTQAYEAEGSVDPLRSLSSFAQDHRDTWRSLRDRLPLELHDISSEVTGVFEAIEEGIGPLAALLPLEPDDATASAGRQPQAGASGSADLTDGSAGPTSSHPTASASASPSPGPGTANGSASHEEGRSSAESSPWAQGLLGSAGLLGGSSSDGTSESPTASDEPEDEASPERQVTIPPLVEELLPDLGLDG
ncbi:DUF5667 domain-containing protein [Streptomyces sp. 4N509B]|uniref:DUF5667 domain-containing protein n=1 Tax=Streptomyces sp. 4N509B TaxID=3457413 RepID=UPI003FD30693